MNDNTDNWYRKVRDIIDKQQSGALWMSESKVYKIIYILVMVAFFSDVSVGNGHVFRYLFIMEIP